ncbi:helix-turn-helix domain-containing protein [Halocatena pleomorpha]|uniref:helix-turn-helix domain-containing protein n=1 Tax=Halocatena pleomorpha TaxID=1785090 RepID=UPI00163B261C|nr:helix-turn-helix domain-containing protein [Halocatena pleomorpha]
MEAEDHTDDTDLTTTDCVRSVQELFRGRGVREYLAIVDNPDNCLLVTDCFEKALCKTSISFAGDVVRITLVASEETINEISQSMENSRFRFQIIRLRKYTGMKGSLDALTQRQKEVIQLAYEQGHYNVPQQISIKELATMLELDKSTVWEHLRRAEQNLLSEIINSDVTRDDRRIASGVTR